MSEQTRPHPPSSTEATSLLKFLLKSGTIGAILAVVVMMVVGNPFWIDWHSHGLAPQSVDQIIAGTLFDIYVQDPSGKVYSCDVWNDECRWVRDVLPADLPEIEACDQGSPAFRSYTIPPTGIISCIQFHDAYAESGGQIFLALDDNRVVWQWADISTAYEIFIWPIVLIAGGMIGILLGTLIWTGYHLLRKRTEDQPRITRAQVVLLVLPWLLAAFCGGAQFLNAFFAQR